MGLIFAAIAAAGALNGAPPADATTSDTNPDTVRTSPPSACRAARVIARADLVYKPDPATAPLVDKVVVVIEQTQRASELARGEAAADDAPAAATEPERLLVCGPRHRAGGPGA